MNAARRPWSPEEDAYLREWYARVGIDTSNIALDLKRPRTAVQARIRRLDLYPPKGGLALGRTVRKRPA